MSPMKAHSKSRQNNAISVGDKSSSKETKQLAVSIAILETIENDGLLGVTHSKVSRRSGVSRAWIYEYIGKEKTELIEFGADVFASYIARIALTELPNGKLELQAQLKDGIDFLFDSMEQNPLIIKLFFRFRGSENPVGKVILKYEKKWLDSAQFTIQQVLGLPKEDASLLAELILTLRLGFSHRIVTSQNPRSSRERAEGIFNLIHAMVSGFSVEGL